MAVRHKCHYTTLRTVRGKLTHRSTCFSPSRRLPRVASLFFPFGLFPSRVSTRVDVHASLLRHAPAMIPSQQTRRSTRRSLGTGQGVENDVANRVPAAAGRVGNALASGSAAIKPAPSKVVAGTSAQTRRPLGVPKPIVMTDKVRFRLLFPPHYMRSCTRRDCLASHLSTKTIADMSVNTACREQRCCRRARQAQRVCGRDERGQGESWTFDTRRQARAPHRDQLHVRQRCRKLVQHPDAAKVPDAVVDGRRHQGGSRGRRGPRFCRRRQSRAAVRCHGHR